MWKLLHLRTLLLYFHKEILGIFVRYCGIFIMEFMSKL